MAKQSDWRFLSIHRSIGNRDEPRNIVLNIASPAGTVRSVPLSPANLVRIIEESAVQLRLFLAELSADGREET